MDKYDQFVKSIYEQGFYFCRHCLFLEYSTHRDRQYLSCIKCHEGDFCDICIKYNIGGTIKDDGDDGYKWICNKCK